MQQTGTLRKRRRRNIAKVAGLSTVPYDESADTFTGRSMYDIVASRKIPGVMRDSDATRISVSALHREQTSSSRRPSRITYNSNLHIPGNLGEEDFEDTTTQVAYDFEFNNDPSDHKPDPNHKRPFFLNQKTMNRLRQLLLLGMTSGTFPWVWNKKANRIEKFSPRMERLWVFMWAATTLQTAMLTCFQVYSCYARLTTGKKSYREIFMMSFSFYWYIFGILYNLNMYYYKDQIRQYINSLLYMNEKLVNRYVINADAYVDIGRILMNISIPSNTAQVFISVSLFLKCPWQPWYLYSYIYTPENPWWWLIPGALQEFMVVGQVVTGYLLIAWIVVAHTNSVSFWLKETHNHNETGFTTDELRDPSHAMRVYRCLQIICTCFNECMAPLAIPTVQMSVWTGIIPTGYVIIRSMNQVFIDEFPGILTYPCSVLDCVTGGFAPCWIVSDIESECGKVLYSYGVYYYYIF